MQVGNEGVDHGLKDTLQLHSPLRVDHTHHRQHQQEGEAEAATVSLSLSSARHTIVVTVNVIITTTTTITITHHSTASPALTALVIAGLINDRVVTGVSRRHDDAIQEAAGNDCEPDGSSTGGARRAVGPVSLGGGGGKVGKEGKVEGGGDVGRETLNSENLSHSWGLKCSWPSNPGGVSQGKVEEGKRGRG